MALRNYLGGSPEDPCPTGGLLAKLGAKYCNAPDYDSWLLRLEQMWTQALMPTWDAYFGAGLAELEPDGDMVSPSDPIWQRIQRFEAAYKELPEPSRWMGISAATQAVQAAISVGQDGEQTYDLMVAKLQEAGKAAPAVPAGPPAAKPKGGYLPLAVGIGIGAVVATGIAVAVVSSREE